MVQVWNLPVRQQYEPSKPFSYFALVSVSLTMGNVYDQYTFTLKVEAAEKIQMPTLGRKQS